jgi:hypothetical protein
VAAELDFRPVSADEGDTARLVSATVDQMRVLYEGLDLNSPDMPKAGAGELGPPPKAWYEAEGYRPIPNFNANPGATFFGEKRLP